MLTTIEALRTMPDLAQTAAKPDAWLNRLLGAADAAVKRLVLFHHEPEHGDAEMDALLDGARRQIKQRSQAVEVLAAREGMTLTL